MNIQKCAIIGSGGVGATTAFTLIQGGLFNEIVLVDANHKKAEGEALDIGHGVPFIKPVNIYAGEYADLKDAYLVIITAGANRGPGETRLDVASKNTAIFGQIIPEIVKHNKDCILLIVSNPVDILTTLTLKLSNFPSSRVIGSGTVLDTSRLRYLLGKNLRVDARNIHALIIGEHGDSELAVWSSAEIYGLPIEEYCSRLSFCGSMHLNKIYEEVRDSGAKIIEKKGATYYGIAMAIKRIAESLVRDEHSVLPVSCLLKGEYGIDGICMGIPSVVGRSGIEAIMEIPLDDKEMQLLRQSADKLKDTLKTLEK